MKKVAVIGGGPAGMMAAIAAAKNQCDVDLYEQNEKLGKKLYITGKGRCNLTNHCDISDFFEAIVTNPAFMYSALYTFTNDQLMEMIESAGCPLKVERGGRVFPVSDKSSDVIKAFDKLLKREGVHVFLKHRVQSLSFSNSADEKRVTGIVLANGEERPYDKVILATGGKSYVSTGSDGNGYVLAQKAGHRIMPLRASLVGLHINEPWAADLQGLALKNVALTLKRGKKKLFHETGEMLFTHFGISGPLVLSASAYMKEPPKQYTVCIDFKPGLTPEQVENRILRDFEKYQNKNFSNALSDLLPSKMIPVMINYANIQPDKKVHQITREERRRLAQSLKQFNMTVCGLQDLNTAIITSGGVDVREIDPSTMASRKVSGLYFAGEMIDVDALTGGFNIQIAASTGWLAGSEE